MQGETEHVFSCLLCRTCEENCPSGGARRERANAAPPHQPHRLRSLGGDDHASSDRRRHRHLGRQPAPAKVSPAAVPPRCRPGGSESIGLPRGSETVLYTGMMYQLIPYIEGLVKAEQRLGDSRLAKFDPASPQGQPHRQPLRRSWRGLAAKNRRVFDQVPINVVSSAARGRRRVRRPLRGRSLLRRACLRPRPRRSLCRSRPAGGGDAPATRRTTGSSRSTRTPRTCCEASTRRYLPASTSRCSAISRCWRARASARTDTAPAASRAGSRCTTRACSLAMKAWWTSRASCWPRPASPCSNRSTTAARPGAAAAPSNRSIPTKAAANAAKRVEELRRAAPDAVTMCPMCFVNLSAAAGETMRFTDISEYLCQAYAS